MRACTIDLPIYSAAFSQDGSEIIAAGRRKHFYTYDLRAGKVTKIPFIRGREEKSLESFVVSPDNKYIAFLGNDGYIILVSGKTKQWVCLIPSNSSVSIRRELGEHEMTRLNHIRWVNRSLI
jgi:U3 small nucleolar RNA-associated protein 18